MQRNKLVNIAIQVLPEVNGKLTYDAVDEVIRVIAAKGFRYRVCPFETVVECTLPEALDLITEIHDKCEKTGVTGMITNLKIQSVFGRDVTISDKMWKYDKF